MSDRKALFVSESRYGDLKLFMDGETGTWRLYIPPEEYPISHVDFSLSDLRAFHEKLGKVLKDIEANQEDFNAEFRMAHK